MKKKQITLALLASIITSNIYATPVKVTMNSTSTTMSLANKSTGETINVGQPVSRVYSFDAPQGTYVLTAYASNGTTINGTIEINLPNETEQQEISVFTNTIYATNKNWTYGTDYTINVDVCSREGDFENITLGNSTTSGRKTFLALNGNSYYASLKPSASHQKEGYMDLLKSGTLTAGVTISGEIPIGKDYTVTLPSDAGLFIGTKTAHYISFNEVKPAKTTIKGNTKQITFRLANKQVYTYRTWRDGGLTQGGYFTMDTIETKRPTLTFTDNDYSAFDPKTIIHDVNYNGGYETGDIFLNINKEGHLKLNKVGDKTDIHAMRSWQLTDTQTNNYFIEPDFHFTIIGLDGKPCDNIIRLTQYGKDPWESLQAIGKGTAIVLVTYDAIGLNYYSVSGSDYVKNPYMGGEYWGAIWPENTGVFVVTVGEDESTVTPNMFINQDYNEDTKKLAGKFVDAEHDVFYYLDTEEGYNYTFNPSGVKKIEIAYPTIGTQTVTYNGFSNNGVTKNGDGSYSLLLKEGRQIIRLTDASGNSSYQILTAKRCHREIINAKRPGSNIFQPGDNITIQYSGLRHPANKLSAIYNMSAYVTYNGIPNGSSLILGSGQYTFGSVASAQAVTVSIPNDYDVTSNPYIIMDKGVIQVNGYGDPIGNHRNTSRTAGRSPNFTAIAHKTYFGAIPDVRIPITDIKNFNVTLNCDIDDVNYQISTTGVSTPIDIPINADGTFTGTYGSYLVTATKSGYRCQRTIFTIADDAEGNQYVDIALDKAPIGAWDGSKTTEPAKNNGIYQIKNGAELAWFAAYVNSGSGVTAEAELIADIDLADYQWTAIGTNTSTKQFKGTFNGNGHSIKGLYINNSSQYQGLFGYANAATITNLKVYGEVKARSMVGALIGYATGACVFDRLENHAAVTATDASSYAAGILGRANTATVSLTNCANYATISGTNYVGGILNYYTTAANMNISNVLNAGQIIGTQTGSIRGWNNATAVTGTNISNAYAVKGYFNETMTNIVTSEQMQSGEIAYLLGEAWGQNIGIDQWPSLGGKKVLFNEGIYYNEVLNNNYDFVVLDFEEDGWTDYIDNPQYGGPQLYGEYGMGFDNPEESYSWTDAKTQLHSELSEGYGVWCYWSGGHAVSNYASNDIEAYGNFETQLTVYSKEADDLATVGGGHNGSNNFAVHYGYADNSGWGLTEESLPALTFADNQPRVINHMYVTNTCYNLYCYYSGNNLTASIAPGDWVKIVATGYNGESKTDTAEIYLCNGPEYIVTDWKKFDLSKLGLVTRITFNVTGSSDNGYGFSQPAYFAYDDVTIRIPRQQQKPTLASVIINDKTVYTNSQKIDVEKLIYNRTFGTTLWQPLYVPFTSKYAQWKNNVTIARVTENNGNNIYIDELDDDDLVEANTPYFVKAKETGSYSFVLNEATLYPAQNDSYNYFGITFTGTYSPLNISPFTHSVLHNGTIVKTSNTSGYKLPSMRWYVDSPTGEAKIIFEGEIETTITQTSSTFPITIKAIYSIDGTPRTTLRPGINIVRKYDGSVEKIISK